MQGSARKDVVFGAARVYTFTVPGPKWKSWLKLSPDNPGWFTPGFRVQRTLRACPYPALSKKDKGIVRRYLAKVSGLSRSQITRLIARWRERGVIAPRASRRRRFPRRYTSDDIARLAAVDAAHEGLSAPAIRRILERECKVYGKTEYQRLAAISPSHIYNLRRTRAYREHHVHHTKTRAAAVSIGERRKPDPGGRPGYLRVDTVHQGDTDSGKGLYHINAVDTVTQWEVVGCCQTISEAHLKPVLEAMLHQFPFRVRGFHSDNGSEFLNYRVARLLEKMRVEEFTKSRAHRSTDNALVEGTRRPQAAVGRHATRTPRNVAARRPRGARLPDAERDVSGQILDTPLPHGRSVWI